MTKPSIQQHPLLNEAGDAVSFDMQRWSGVEYYDTSTAHRHHFHEILVFENGNAQHDIDFTTYTANPGSVHFVASDNVHLLLRKPASKGYSLLFTTDYIAEELFAQLPFSKTQPVVQLSKADMKQMNTITQQIAQEHDAPQAFSERIIKSLMETLLLLLLRAYNNEYKEKVQSSQPQHIQQFTQLVKENYLHHYSVEVYAEMLNISAKHLIELCKKNTGKTPLKYIQEHMVCEAKRQLFHTQQSVKEIAYALQFDDPANFSKYFKAVTGYSPAAYRKSSR